MHQAALQQCVTVPEQMQTVTCVTLAVEATIRPTHGHQAVLYVGVDKVSMRFEDQTVWMVLRQLNNHQMVLLQLSTSKARG